MNAVNQHRRVLILLLAVNLLNYIDRQVLYAVFPLLKADLHLSDTALGLLGSAFMVSYMVTAPFFGWLGDRQNRPRLAAAGLVTWSLATTMGGLATGYRSLLAARTVVGIGEASFGTVSPGLLADWYPRERRARALAWFYAAIPVGSALGYILGGVIGHAVGWQAAFLIVGLPGILLAIPTARMRDPRPAPPAASGAQATGQYARLVANRSFLLNTLAMAAMTFALGGLAQWLPSFLQRMHGLDVARGNTLFGAITVVAGLAGTLTGGWLGDRMQGRGSRGYLLVSAWGFLLGVPLACWAIMAPELPACLAAIFLAEFFLFLNTGPLNTVIIAVTGAEVRAMAFALNIFLIHALGDAISPTIIGWLSDRYGLRHAMLLAPATIALAALFCFACMVTVDTDESAAGS